MSNVTRKYSISMPEDLAETVRARTGPGGFSAFVTAAVARQMEREQLRELIDAAEAEHGPVDRQAVEEARAALRANDRRDSGSAAA
ncbi:CopG family transcriptional regulator [Streptomyces sp. A3M-1-3]|uniref:CopG family transcriptional regulator n=1 Tax=Streptomyces sp. A3M-1-3 TaxID=2962044 RepID=UPI0020B8F447|nr:CopG family transcriptional regulator [Streptomyces sp. A3M-1-3]MCP3821213.1 CopG family transcriptional regulator [Streptomyces sp. A3M-1-3]